MKFNTLNGFGTIWDNNKKQQKHQNDIQHSKLDMQHQAFQMDGNDHGETKQNNSTQSNKIFATMGNDNNKSCKIIGMRFNKWMWWKNMKKIKIKQMNLYR